MKPYLVSGAIAVATVAVALGLFVAGFFVRGWVDQTRVVAVPTPDCPVAIAPALSTPSVSPIPTIGTPSAATAVPTLTAPAVAKLSVDGSPARGPENARVTIIEFSDFQCSFCKRYVDETLPLILSSYGDRVRYVFRNLPIANIHPQAQKAAEAAQCAFEQGKFWEYHDRLFQNQGALDVPNLKAYAKALGLDEGTFGLCLESGKYVQVVQMDFNEALANGVTGTPTFFINGRKLAGAQPFSAFQKVIDEELAKAGGG